MEEKTKACHPAMRPRRMTCKKINHITSSEHGTLLVEYDRHTWTDSDTGEPIGEPVAVLECASLFDIKYEFKKTEDGSGFKIEGIIFGFVKYFTDEERKKLQADFDRGEYDDLGDLTEF